MRSILKLETMAALSIGVVLACGGPQETPVVEPQYDPRGFEAFTNALGNTLIEVNELERMGGGIKDRMVLIEASSLVQDADQLRLVDTLTKNYAKIQSLRTSLLTNKGVQEVLARNGKTLEDVVAMDAKAEGVVVLYYETP
jgi:hypothetical protein